MTTEDVTPLSVLSCTVSYGRAKRCLAIQLPFRRGALRTDVCVVRYAAPNVTTNSSLHQCDNREHHDDVASGLPCEYVTVPSHVLQNTSTTKANSQNFRLQLALRISSRVI